MSTETTDPGVRNCGDRAAPQFSLKEAQGVGQEFRTCRINQSSLGEGLIGRKLVEKRLYSRPAAWRDALVWKRVLESPRVDEAQHRLATVIAQDRRKVLSPAGVRRIESVSQGLDVTAAQQPCLVFVALTEKTIR